MKLLHTADWHVGRTVAGRSRADEHRAVLTEIASIAADERVDLVLVAGDLFDSPSPSPEAESVLYRGLLALAEVAPVVIIAGNHDHPHRWQAIEPLMKLGRIQVAGMPKPVSEGGRLEVSTAAGPASVALLPFLSQRFVIDAAALMGGGAAEYEQTYAGRVGSILQHLTADLPEDMVSVVVAHLTVLGGRADGSERAGQTFLEYVVPGTLLPGGVHYLALGHLHRQQRVPAAAPAWYAGSPLQLDFGEGQDQKGVLLIEVTPSTPAIVTPRPLTGGRPMLTLKGTLEQLEALVTSVTDAHLRVIVEEAAGVGVYEQVKAWFPSASQVRLETPQPAVTTEYRLGRPPRQLFAEYLGQRGRTDEAILALFEELLEEANAPATA
jgi:exonuclease SbcD